MTPCLALPFAPPSKLQDARAHPNPDPYGRSNAADEQPAGNTK